jgi:ATP-dependent Lon protease
MKKPKIVNIDNLSLQQMFDEDSELIPLLTPEDEEEINKESIPEILPTLPFSESKPKPMM